MPKGRGAPAVWQSLYFSAVSLLFVEFRENMALSSVYNCAKQAVILISPPNTYSVHFFSVYTCA